MSDTNLSDLKGSVIRLTQHEELVVEYKDAQALAADLLYLVGYRKWHSNVQGDLSPGKRNHLRVYYQRHEPPTE